ncbi:phage baseplate protein [Aerococcaceae bacterium 50-4]
MAINFYLDIEGKRHLLPVNPSNIEIKNGSNNQTVEISAIGDVNIGGARSLISASFSSFFPKDYKAGYVNKYAKEEKNKNWIDRLTNAKNNHDKVRLIVTDTDINQLMLIEDFSWGYEDSTGDVVYTLSFKEYREVTAIYKKTIAKKINPKPRPAPKNKPITIGCQVIVNGRLHRDSYGSGPGLTEKNARRQVNLIAKGRPYPYHVCMLDGTGRIYWRGWVTAGSVKRV